MNTSATEGGGIPTVSVPDIAAGMCRSKRNYFPYSFSGTLWHPVDRFQFDASYKIGQWSNRTGGIVSVNWNILAVSVRTIDVTGGSSGDK